MNLNKGQFVSAKELMWTFILLIGAAVLFLAALRLSTGTEGCGKYIRRSGANPRGCVDSDKCRLVAESNPLSPEGEDKNYYVRCKTAVHSHGISCVGQGCDTGNCVDDKSSKDYGTCAPTTGKNYYMCSLD